MNHKILIALVITMLHWGAIAKAQITYGVMAKAGQSGFESINLAPYNRMVGMEYNPTISYGIGSFVKYKPWNLPFSIEQALSINKLGTTLRVHNFKNTIANYDFPYCAISLPLSLHYHHVEWLSVYGGIAYTYNIKNTKLHDYQYTTFYPHNFDYSFGVDFTIKKKISIGGYYQKSFNRFMDTSYQFGYTSFHYGIKVGYFIKN